MNGTVIEASFELSVCLHLNKESKFAFKALGKNVEVGTSDVIRENSRFGSGKNVEIYSDIDSGFRYTQVKIQFIDPDPNIPVDKLETVYEDVIVEATNRFIDAYRFVTGRVAIVNIASLSDISSIHVGRRNPQGGGSFLVAINFGSVGIGGEKTGMGPFKPDLEREREEEIRRILSSEEIPLHDYFIMDARRHVQIGHKIQALISAVIALEITMRSIKPQNGWLVRFFHRRKLLNYNLRKELKSRFPEESLALIIGGINLRDKVIHGGQRELTIDVRKFIDKAEEAIRMLTS